MEGNVADFRDLSQYEKNSDTAHHLIMTVSRNGKQIRLLNELLLKIRSEFQSCSHCQLRQNHNKSSNCKRYFSGKYRRVTLILII